MPSQYQSPPKSSTLGSSYKKSSPLRPSDESELLRAFKQQLILDREFEHAKLDILNNCPDFNLYDAFLFLDRESRGFIDSYDLMRSFRDERLLDLAHLSEEDAELLMARLDKDRDRKVRFSEFSSTFAPCSDLQQTDRLHARKGLGQLSSFSDKTFLLFRNLWLTLVKVE